MTNEGYNYFRLKVAAEHPGWSESRIFEAAVWPRAV
jgi:hypothetical protein